MCYPFVEVVSQRLKPNKQCKQTHILLTFRFMSAVQAFVKLEKTLTATQKNLLNVQQHVILYNNQRPATQHRKSFSSASYHSPKFSGRNIKFMTKPSLQQACAAPSTAQVRI